MNIKLIDASIPNYNFEKYSDRNKIFELQQTNDWSLRIHFDRKPFWLSSDLAVLSKIIPSATAVIDRAFLAVWFPGWSILNDLLNTTCTAAVVPQD